MTTIQVFDPARCNSGCGCSADPSEATFAADIQWATQMGARIERASPSQHPEAFTGNPVVRAFLERSGIEALPLVLVDGEVALAGRYPTRAELAKLAGFEPVAAGEAGNCCSGGRCCG